MRCASSPTCSRRISYDDELISEGNFEHNIIPNNEASFNYIGKENDILIRYKTSPNNQLNIHYLDLTKEMNLRYDKSNEGNTIQILLYFKIPNTKTSDLKIIITITSNDSIDLKDLKIGGSTEDYLYKTLSNQTPSYSIEGDKTKTSDNIYELTLSSSNISSLKSDNNNYIYICTFPF